MSHIVETELRLMTILTWKVRIVTDVQATTTLGIPPDARAAFVRRLQRLASRGLLGRQSVVVALFQLEGPLVDWLPGMPESPWHSIAWQLQRRYSTARPRRVWVNWATRQAVALVGGAGGRLRQPLQVQHDLGVAALHVSRTSEAGSDTQWIGEDPYRTLMRPPERSKIPDALIVDRNNRVRRAVEFGGLYCPARLGNFHRYWAKKGIPYEIW